MSLPDVPCAVFNLRRTTRAVTQLYDEILRPTGLRATQYSLLRVLQGRGPVAVTELGELMGMDRTTVTRNVRVLEREGLVAIAPGRDRRTRIVTLSRRGRSAVERALPYWKSAQAAVIDRLGESRWQRLRAELEAVTLVGASELDERTAS